MTREPGGTDAAEEIRAVLLADRPTPMSERAEVLLFAAARADHVARVIAPAIQRGQAVLCDRFVDSSIAYQGYARVSTWRTCPAESLATAGLRPGSDGASRRDAPGRIGPR